MRVFVVGTGRCGTCTFYQACREITNYTVGHESDSNILDFSSRLEYPDQRIEIASHLFTEIGILDYIYPRSKWVHLIRNPEKCIKSLAKQTDSMRSYARQWLGRTLPLISDNDFYEVANTFYQVVNEGIRNQLKHLDSMTIPLENIQNEWGYFWDWIGAEGDFNASKQILKRKYNPSEHRGRDVFI